MEQISFAMAAIIGTTLVSAIVVLFKLYVSARDSKDKDKECKERVRLLEAKVEDIFKMVVKKADLEVIKTEQREQRAWDRALELSRILEKTSEITRHAMRIIRRHESDAEITPTPRSKNLDPTIDINIRTTPSHEQSKNMSDETSRFVKDGTQQ